MYDMELADKETKFLHTRQLLKEAFRKKMKGQLSNSDVDTSINGVNKKYFPCYGSFFGPSQPSIAKRVIEESKLVEFQTKATRLRNSQPYTRESSSSLNNVRSTNKHALSRDELRSKAKMLKYSRDYSFLFSKTSTTTAAETPIITLPPKDPQTSTGQVKSRSKQIIISESSKEYYLESRSRGKQTCRVRQMQPANNKHSGKKREYSSTCEYSNKDAKKQKRSTQLGKQLNVDVSSIIRKIFRYDPCKYRGDEYENDYAMVSNFADIQKEERRSERIGRKEDEIELQLVEQQERKHKKLNHGKKKTNTSVAFS